MIAAQGYASRRRRGRPIEVAATVARLSAVQLDSISTVDRSHRITLASRVGAYPRGTVSKLLERGALFEYWAHECCLLPVADWPLYRHVMVNDGTHPWWGAIIEKRARAGRPGARRDPRARAARLPPLRGASAAPACGA